MASEREPLLPVHYPPVYGNAADVSSTFRPLVSSQEEEGQYASAPSVPPLEAASLATVNEIREAALQEPYPPWIYGAPVTPDASSPQPPQGGMQGSQKTPTEQGLTEEEARELLTDYVQAQGCWGGRPADEWPISKIEDCNVYVATLETFIEERDVERLVKPYTSNGAVDGSSSSAGARVPGPWEIDMRHEFPLLFTARKVAQQRIPSSESVKTCGDCSGRKEIVCPLCNANKDINSSVSGLTTECSSCHGRGLLAHQDGSDTKCGNCQGKGRLLCTKCKSRGRILCGKCQGSGALLESQQLNVTWSTLKSKKISTSSNATLVPEDVFIEAKGVQLYASEAYQCTPVSFPNSPVLTRLSSDVIADRVPVPPTARVVCERHLVHMIPVTRVSVDEGKRAFKFYVVGLEKRVYLKEYPDRHMGPGAVLGAGAALGAGALLALAGGLAFLWKATQKPRHSRQFITRM